MLKKSDDTICPFCRSKNQCMSQVEKACWCNTVDVPKELRDIALEESRGKVCICLTCIESFKKEPDDFKKIYGLIKV